MHYFFPDHAICITYFLCMKYDLFNKIWLFLEFLMQYHLRLLIYLYLGQFLLNEKHEEFHHIFYVLG